MSLSDADVDAIEARASVSVRRTRWSWRSAVEQATEVITLCAEIRRLRAALAAVEEKFDEAQLRSIEARNPGIDMDEVRRTTPRAWWLQDHRIYTLLHERLGRRHHDPLFLRGVMRDDELVVLARCPQCGSWGELDYDQLHGRVSTHHDQADGGCGYHDTVNWIERYTA